MLHTHFQDFTLEAGCDEAGRGCLAGPVFAAAVILPKGFSHPLLNDSKQLSEKVRAELRPLIEDGALAWAVAALDAAEIDRLNIHRASYTAMHRAVEALKVPPGLLLIDGNRFIPHAVPHRCFVGGDGRFASIAAASVLAKTARDAYMEALHAAHPEYGWLDNKGYATRHHREALDRHGPTVHHRRSFRLSYGTAGAGALHL